MKALSVLLVSAIAFAAEPALFIRGTYVMGTVATVKVYAPNEAAAQEHAVAAFTELRRLENIFTNYRDSELTRLNAAAADGSVKLSDEMFELLRLSVEYSRKYDGAFDPTVGPAVRAWGFLGGPFRTPPVEEQRRLRELVGVDGLELDTTLQAVRFRRRGMELDFGGIAKGYAAEMVARLLARAGVEHGLVSLGESSLFTLGPPPGRQGWPVAVLDPRPPHKPFTVIELPPFSALSTSGAYGRTFRDGAHVYTHLFDPSTAEPLSIQASATVICRSGAESEAAVKAILLLPPAKRQVLNDVQWLRLEVARGKLLISQDHQRAQLRRPAGRDVAGQQRHPGQQHRKAGWR